MFSSIVVRGDIVSPLIVTWVNITSLIKISVKIWFGVDTNWLAKRIFRHSLHVLEKILEREEREERDSRSRRAPINL